MDGYYESHLKGKNVRIQLVDEDSSTYIPRILRSMGGQPRVLDFGCGRGELKDIDCIEWEGYDIDRGNPVATYHDRSEIKGTYDCIVLKHVAEHMTPEELFETIDWLIEHSRTFIFAFPLHNPLVRFDYWQEYTHQRPIPLQWMAKYLTGKGLRVTAIRAQNSVSRKLRKRLLQKLIGYALSKTFHGEGIIIAEASIEGVSIGEE